MIINFSKMIASIRKKPYVEVVSEKFSTEHGWEIKLDWNKYFVDQLAKDGIEGESDEEMVYTWLSLLMRTSQIEEYEEELLQAAQDQHTSDREEL